MYWKLGYHSFLRNLVLNLLLILQFAAALFLANVMTAGVNGRSVLFAPLKPYLSQDGGYVGNMGTPLNKDSLKSSLTGVKDVFQTYRVPFLYTQTQEEGEHQFTAYTPDVSRSLKLPLQEGVWYTQAKRDDGVIPVVVTNSTRGYKVGDIIPIYAILDANGESNPTPVKLLVTGILADPAYYLELSQWQEGMDFKGLYSYHNMEYYLDSPMFLTDVSYLDGVCGYYTSFNAIVTFEKGLSKADYEANMEALESYSIFTSNQELWDNSMDYINAEVKVMMPIIFCLMLVTAVGLLSSGAISTITQLKNYGIYFICGCRWKDCIKISLASNAILLLGATVLSSAAMVVSASLGWLGNLGLVFGLNNVVNSVVLILITFVIAAVVPAIVLQGHSPVEIVKGNE